ncbi:MAG: hypothetical protein LIO54_08425 [Oscillospiraceae bacterium]|nr:hypothetical protein [Oscillospiraceae bacterium]
MTFRELRQALTEIDNQEMTIKELRDILFELEDQDAQVKDNDLLKITFGK